MAKYGDIPEMWRDHWCPYIEDGWCPFPYDTLCKYYYGDI